MSLFYFDDDYIHQMYYEILNPPQRRVLYTLPLHMPYSLQRLHTPIHVVHSHRQIQTSPPSLLLPRMSSSHRPAPPITNEDELQPSQPLLLPRISRPPSPPSLLHVPLSLYPNTYDMFLDRLLMAVENELLAEELVNGLAELRNNYEDVVVAPSQQDIENGSKVVTQVSDDTICAICQEHAHEDRRWRVLSCQHSFHMPCIKQWFEQNVHCPVCRADIRQ